MPTKLSIWNGALIECEAKTLSSVTENRESRRVLDEVWNNEFIERQLSLADWNFAIRTVKLTASTSIEPDFGLRYAFEKPSDWLRTAALCSDERFSSPLVGYEDEATVIYSDLDEIYGKYVSNDASYGLDMSNWPPIFTEFVEIALAKRIHRRLTGAKSDYQEIKKEYRERLSIARGIDARDQSVSFAPTGNWASSRRRGRNSRYRER